MKDMKTAISSLMLTKIFLRQYTVKTMGEIDFFHVFYVIRFLEVNFGLPSFTTFLLLTLNLIGVFVQVSQLGGFRRINFAHLLI